MRNMYFIMEDDGMNLDANPRSESVITVKHSEVYLPNILEQFENFLKAAGFHFDGHLQIVEPDEEVVAVKGDIFED